MQLEVEDTCVDSVDNPWRDRVCILSRVGKYVNREGILNAFYFISSHYTRVIHITVYGNAYWSIRELPFRLWNII